MHPSRILFVDDEPAFEKIYRAMGDLFGRDCEVVTVRDGKRALEVISDKPVDVVVSDLEMPNMTGAEFLSTVEQRFPQAMRIVVSGNTDQLAIARCLMFGHRYFQKPFKTQEFADTIQRVCKLKHQIQDKRIQGIIGSVGTLPSPPETYLRLTEALESKETSMEAVAEIVEADPALTAKLLQVVNSAQYGIARAITSPLEAIQVVGVEVLRALMLGLHAIGSYKSRKFKSISLSDLWAHSLETGMRARELAQVEKRPDPELSRYYIAGLLHDIGKLVLAANADADYHALSRKVVGDTTLVQLEMQHFGANHAQVGAYLLGLWGLPEIIVRAVELHHTLEGVKESGLTPLVAVHAAQNLSPTRGRRGKPDREFLKRCGVEKREEEWTKTLSKFV